MGKTRVSFSWFGVEQQTNKLAHGTGDHTLTDNAHSGRKENPIPKSPHPPRAVEPRNQETIELQHFRDRGAPPPSLLQSNCISEDEEQEKTGCKNENARYTLRRLLRGDCSRGGRGEAKRGLGEGGGVPGAGGSAEVVEVEVGVEKEKQVARKRSRGRAQAAAA